MINNLYENEEKYIKFLQNKGLSFAKEDENKIKEILYKENYNILVKEYQNIFIDKESKKYFEDVTFYSIKALYEFDKNIKNIFFKYILRIEHQVKTIISKVFEEFYGDNGYLKIENYDIYSQNKTLNISKVKNVLSLISRIEGNLSTKIDKNSKIQNYYIKCGYVPFNVFVNTLTLGEISTFFELMKEKDQILVSRIFMISPQDLKNFLSILTMARNLCAHDEKFYNVKYKKIINLKNYKNIEILNIPKKQDNFLCGVNDAFAIAITLSVLLCDEDCNNFTELLETEFAKLSNFMPYNFVLKIQKEMGFTEKWSFIKLINKKSPHPEENGD